jgi:flavorubredoxin
LKIFAVYDTKYGNTKNLAENILEGIKEAGHFEIAIGYAKDVNLQEIAEYDALIMGGPNHMGKPSRTISKFKDSLQKAPLKARWAAVFDTYYAKPKNCGKAMKRMENTINKKLPSLKLIVPGVSIKVEGVNGPIAEGELPKCKEFGNRIANELETNVQPALASH